MSLFDSWEKLSQKAHYSLFRLIQLHSAQNKNGEDQRYYDYKHKGREERSLSASLLDEFLFGFAFFFVFLQIFADDLFIIFVEFVHEGLLELFLLFFPALYYGGIVPDFLQLLLLSFLLSFKIFLFFNFGLLMCLHGLFVLSIERKD